MPALDLIARGLGMVPVAFDVTTAENFQVLLRAPDYSILDEIDDYISLDLVIRDNDIGTWHVELSARSPVAARITDQSGIIVKHNGETILSGWADQISRTGTTITLSGRDDMALLLTPARPDPAASTPPFAVEYHVITGTASTMFRTLVAANIGVAAPAMWQLAPIAFGADPLLGIAPVTLRGRMQSLLTILAESAASPQAGGLGFRLMQSDTVANSLEFTVYEPADRSDDAKFSTDLGTASDYEDTRTLPTANAYYVGLGDGFGNLRTILYGEDAASIAAVGRRIAAFVDMRDVSDTSEGEQRLAEALAGSVTSRQATIVPTPVPSLRYGPDYNLGDLVSFSVDGDTMVDLIREVRITIDERGATIMPMVGQAGSSNDDRTARYIASVQDRLLNLERNWSVPDDSITLAMMRPGSVGTTQLVDDSVTPIKLGAVDTPSNNDVPAYNAGSQQFQWLSVNDLLGTSPTFDNLTVTGSVIVGDGVGSDTLTVNGRIISTVATGTAPLTVSSTTMVANLNAALLGGLARSGFAELSGAAFTGNVSVSGNGLFVDAAGNKVRINSATVSGWDLTVGIGGILAEGGSRFQGAVTVTGGLTVSAGGIDATGSSTFRNSVTITSGGIGVTGSSAFNNAVSITTGGLTVLAGGIDITGSGTFRNGIGVSGASSSFAAAVSITSGGLSILAGGLSVNSGLFTASGGQIGFHGAAAMSRPTITGSKSGNIALANLLANLNNYGLIIDSTT